MENLIETYGYWAVLIGTFIEGETFLVLGGFAAHRGYLHFPLVVLCAFIGSTGGDQFFYFMGRRHPRYILKKFPSWKNHIARVDNLLRQNRKKVMIGFRFMYGFRMIVPFAIGTSPVPIREFIRLSMAGALLWAISIGAAGYFFGAAFEAFIKDVKRFEIVAMIAIAVTGAVIWLRYIYKRSKKSWFRRRFL